MSYNIPDLCRSVHVLSYVIQPYQSLNSTFLQICTKGLISLNGSMSNYSSESLPLADGIGIIAPFLVDADLDSGGTVWSRNTNEPALLKRISSLGRFGLEAWFACINGPYST